MAPSPKRRTGLTFIVFCFLFLIIWGKAFKIQVIDRKVLLEKSRSQILRKVTIYPKRGNIYDRSGNPLALNVQTYSIFTVPKKGKFQKSYRRLARIVPGLSWRDIRKKIHRRKRYTWLARKISLRDEQVEKIKKLKGIYIEAVPKRYYPNFELASQILGFVGIDNTGLSGVEYQFDKRLKGKPRVIKYVKDAKGRAIKFEGQEAGDEAEELHLSIDKDLQAIAEKSLKDAVLEHQAVQGGVGVMDSETGEILAMANYPTFNPNKLHESKQEYHKLSFISDPFEPGSTLKVLTVASALENNVARADTSYYCERGKMVVDGHEISEAETGKIYEWLSVGDIIKHSSNIGVVKVAFDLTYPKLRKTLKRFNIGEKTNIELPGESRGIFLDAKNVSPLSLSNISFGQGVATTGIQMLSAYATIANGGYLVKPTIIKQKKRNVRRKKILRKEVAEDLTKMLVGAVEEGTGGNAAIRYFKVAGKTGTAQRPDKEGGYKGHIPSFIGFPVNIKEGFVAYVYIDRPKDLYYGNQVAAPVFKEIAQYILYKKKDFSSLALSAQEDANVDVVRRKQSSLKMRSFDKGRVPDFKGLDKKSAYMLAKEMAVSVSHVGMGVVYKQSPASGEKIQEGGSMTLYYKPPEYE